MLIEDDSKIPAEINPDALEEAMLDDFLVAEESAVIVVEEEDEREDELDIAFKDDDESW
ncbi:MAG: hypothetical protein JWN37_143 [Candidatus Nomurabacteria bacterium]|nr:hypothetical protein [Candidatus Nomurabacteria bacterium]